MVSDASLLSTPVTPESVNLGYRRESMTYRILSKSILENTVPAPPGLVTSLTLKWTFQKDMPPCYQTSCFRVTETLVKPVSSKNLGAFLDITCCDCEFPDQK